MTGQRNSMMQENKTKTRTGAVISISGKQSIQVAIEYKVKHPKYGKYVKRRMKLAVHDQNCQSQVGDVVEIAECRPHSKTKSWRVVNVLQKAG
jgi:small subunit ribosomal protein S17